MYRRIVLLVFILLPLHLSAQTAYKKGYCIYNDGVRKSCYLQNHGNETVGEDYLIKISSQDEPQEVDIKLIREFGIDGRLKFVREYIEVDVSGDQIRYLKDTLNHEVIQSGHVFLQQIIGSEIASLYYFLYGGKEFFFYRIGDSGVIHLLYKKFSVEIATGVTSQILYDKRFKLQLEQDMPCSIGTESVSYTMKSLSDYVQTYVEENGGKISFFKDLSRGKFNTKLSTSANHSTFSISDGEITKIDYGSQIDLSYGIELEYLLPFNRNMIGLFGEANYLRYTDTYSGYAPDINYLIDYRILEFPVGFCYNLALTDKFKLFFKAGFIPNIILDGSQITFYRPANSYDLVPTLNLFASVGLAYGIFSAEFRTQTNKNLTPHLVDRGSVYEQVSIRMALRVFQLD